MAKVKFTMDLLSEGIKLAEKENEKKELINHMADFCEDYNTYFAHNLYENFEDTVVESIDYCHEPSYEYEEFNKVFEKTCEAFNRFKEWYESLFSDIIISYIVYATDPVSLDAFLKSIFLYPRTDIEVIVADEADSPDLKKVANKYKKNNIKYIKGDVDLLPECKGIFVFEFNDNCTITEYAHVSMIEVITENPQAGIIIYPFPAGKKLTEKNYAWEALSPDNERIKLFIQHADGIRAGYRRDIIAGEGMEAVPIDWVTMCEDYNMVVFAFPLYKYSVKKDKDENA